MTWAQVQGGQKLHLVLEAGEETHDGKIIRAGRLSRPLCNRRMNGNYRMTINVPLAHACRNCVRIARARGWM